MIEANQADRGAAVEAYLAQDIQCDLGGVNAQFLRDMIDGERDDDALLQAFAAHRVATEAKIVKFLRKEQSIVSITNGEMIAHAIEEEEHLQ
jgi:hypothetical protein